MAAEDEFTISEKLEEWGKKANAELRRRGFRVDSDLSADEVGAKIRRTQLEKTPVMLICGPKEMDQGAVAPRLDDGKQLEVMPLGQVAGWLGKEAAVPRGGLNTNPGV